MRSRGHHTLILTIFALGALIGALSPAPVSADVDGKRAEAAAVWAAENPEICAMLDNPQLRGKMDGLLFKLATLCGRTDLVGGVAQEANEPTPDALGTDVRANDPATDSGSSRTQSETSVAVNETTGTLCSGYNDSFHGVTQGQGYTGWSRSTDAGVSWTDRGALGAASFGDPAMVWRKSDGNFYFAALHSSGLGVWRSTDDCLNFPFLAVIHSGGGDDKELMVVDNNPASPFYGRLYVAWTDFNAGARIFETHSDNGTTWSTPVGLSVPGTDVQGAWPAIAPNGDVYVAWVRWNPWPSGPMDIEVARSTNGGVSYALVANPMTGGGNPQAAAATAACGRPALNGNIRYLPSPQIAVGPDGAVHVIYAKDPDGMGVGDVVNSYYRRSATNGASWDPEVQLNDVGTNDQFFATLSVGATNAVSTSWYDRRLDGANLRVHYFGRTSFNGGVTWGPNVQITDTDSPIVLDPNLATCYHGDYDTQTQSASAAVLVWSDDRANEGGGNNPDVWTDTIALSTDFLVLPSPAAQEICAPANAVVNLSVPSFNAFALPVTLSTSGVPAGATVNFSVNPVTPGGSSVLTLGNTGAVVPGTSTVTITGTAAGPITHTGDAVVTIAAGNPAAASLTAPANGAPNVPSLPTFTWGAVTGASTYSIQVATNAGFSNIVASATGLAAPTWTSNVALNTSTQHFWRVQATNACGTGIDSAVFNFTTVAAPGDCGPGTLASIAYQYGFEAGASGWTHSGTDDTWAIVATNPHSGTSQYHAADPATISDQRLVSPAVVLPTGQNPVVLKFWHVPALESAGAADCYDGGILEVSTNGGATWTQVPTGDLLVGPYTGPVSTGFANPLAGLDAWCGAGAYFQTVADISAYAGQSAQFRLRLGSDNSVSATGWDVDDVVVQSCEDDPMPFLDGFESNDMSAWSVAVP